LTLSGSDMFPCLSPTTIEQWPSTEMRSPWSNRSMMSIVFLGAPGGADALALHLATTDEGHTGEPPDTARSRGSMALTAS
jgi:hypothetical protein